MVTMHWSMAVFVDAIEIAKLPASSARIVVDKLETGLALMRQLEDELVFPVPFPYFHLLSLMVCVNLILLAICMGFANSHLSCAVFLVADLVFLGMLEVSSAMTDPFGDDEVDFPIGHWLRSTNERAELLMEYCSPIESPNHPWPEILEHHCYPVLLEAGLGASVYGITTTNMALQTQRRFSPGLGDLETTQRRRDKIISVQARLRDSNEDDDEDDDD